jgi:thiosulfate reductase cytochrome b subunit
MDGAKAHTAGAQNEYAHEARMIVCSAISMSDVPEDVEETVAGEKTVADEAPGSTVEVAQDEPGAGQPGSAGVPPASPSPQEPTAGETPALPGAGNPVDEHAGQRLVVIKHHALVRLSHWLNVPILFALIVSGFSIYWASPVFLHKPDPVTHSRDYLADVGITIARHVPHAEVTPNWFYDHFGLGVFNLAGALRWHWLFIYLFLINGFLYLLGLLLGRGYRALLPRRSMLGESLAMVRYYAGVIPMKIARRPWPHPEITTKYNALQRGAYASMPIAGALALASGWAMHKPVQFWWLERMFGSYDGARIVHFIVMIYFILFLIPHLVLVAVDGWDTMRSMIVGWSKRTAGGSE